MSHRDFFHEITPRRRDPPCVGPGVQQMIFAMNFCGRWFVGFGAFLILCGVAGYLSNPAEAKTALMSGGTFGGLSALWGVLMLKGFAWAKIAAWFTTVMLVVAFAWRSVAGWMAYAEGEPKLFAASLITTMLAASLASLLVLWRRERA